MSTSIAQCRGRIRSKPDDRGVITGMLVIFAICLLLTIVAVTDLSAAYLRRQAAMSLADGASLAATSAAAAGAIYHPGHQDYVPINQAAAAAAVRRYLATTGAYGHYPGLRSYVQVVGHRVLVQLTMPYRLPIPVPGVRQVTLVHATSAAELPIYQ
jgi:putative Flp pilus-assembly TadE/G-like protein